MTTKEKIIKIFEYYSYIIEDQAGVEIKVIDEDNFDVIALEIESNIRELDLPNNKQIIKMETAKEIYNKFLHKSLGKQILPCNNAKSRIMDMIEYTQKQASTKIGNPDLSTLPPNKTSN